MKVKVFPAEIAALNEVLAFVEEELELAECPMKYVIALQVSIEEIFVNIARYAYTDGGEVTIGIEYDADNGAITFRMEDAGVPFNPLAKKDPDITLSAEEREIGGLGIYLMKQTMDEASYSYENGKNILTMVRKLK